MVRKLRQLRADLRRAGYAPARQRGSHERWRHPLVPDFRVTLARARAAREQQEKEQKP